MCLSSIETPCWLRDGNLILPDMAQPWDAGRLRQHGSGPACLLRTYMHISACIHAAQHDDCSALGQMDISPLVGSVALQPILYHTLSIFPAGTYCKTLGSRCYAQSMQAALIRSGKGCTPQAAWLHTTSYNPWPCGATRQHLNMW